MLYSFIMRTFQSVGRFTRLNPSSILSQKCLWFLTFLFNPIALVAALFIFVFHVSHIIFISLIFPGRLFLLRDRPFNLKWGGGGVMVFRFVQKFVFGQHKRYNIFFFCRGKRDIFFQKFTLGYMNQIIFFSSITIRIFFSPTLEKNHIPPPTFQVKWAFPKLFI